MLNSIRGSLKGVVAWIFAILMIASFSLVGVQNVGSFKAKPPISVGNATITQRELLDQFNLAWRQEQSQGRATTREEALAGGIKDRVIADLSIEAVVREEAEKLGLTMPRQTVSDILSRDERFRSKLSGKFDEKILTDILQQNSLTPSQFDRLMRKDLLRRTLLEATSAGPEAPRALADVHIARQTERRKVTWLLITDAMAGGAVDPTPEDLQTWYAANPATFTSPQYRTLSIVFLRNEDFEADLEVAEDELRKTYDLNRATLYEEPETRTLYQLTYPNEGEAAAAVARLRTGVPFELLASDRGTTLAASTLTNATQKSIVDQTVAQAAFAAPAEPGTILDPIANLFGATVVQIVDVTPKTIKPFDEVKDEIRTAMLSQQTQKLVYEKYEAIESERDRGTNLREAAQKAGIALQTFGPVDRFSFTPGGAILDGIPGEALEEGFILSDGEESQAIELSDDQGFVMLIVDEVIDPALKPFAEVASEVQTGWQAEQRRARVDALARTLSGRVKAGETLETIGAEFDRAPITETLAITARQHDTISPALNDKIFAADLNAEVTGDARGGDAQIIATINDITFARGAISPQELAGYKQYIGLQLNQEILQAYVQTMQQEYGIAYNQEIIDRTFSADSN